MVWRSNSNEIDAERRHRGHEAWQRLEALGGIWPVPSDTSGYWQESFWPGMGQYGFEPVQAVMRLGLPKVDANRAWPWVAAATFEYESDRMVARDLHNTETDSNRLVETVAHHADCLADALMALDSLLFQSPIAVGTSHWEKVRDVAATIDAALGGPTSAMSLSTGRTAMQARLKNVARICNERGEPVGQDRRRGATDPHLRKLVLQLAMFQFGTTGKRPSAAKPGRKDDGDGPFVRLVNGCAKLAGGPGASRKQVLTVLKSIP